MVHSAVGSISVMSASRPMPSVPASIWRILAGPAVSFSMSCGHVKCPGSTSVSAQIGSSVSRPTMPAGARSISPLFLSSG
jgi:hypothetical protein